MDEIQLVVVAIESSNVHFCSGRITEETICGSKGFCDSPQLIFLFADLSNVSPFLLSRVRSNHPEDNKKEGNEEKDYSGLCRHGDDQEYPEKVGEGDESGEN